MYPMGKTKGLTRLKDAASYPVWWLRFVPYARRCGFDRLITHRENYVDVIRAEAAAAKARNRDWLRRQRTLVMVVTAVTDSGLHERSCTDPCPSHRQVTI